MKTTEQMRDAAVNDFLLAAEAIPGHGPATPKELRLAERLYIRAFREGRETRSQTVTAALAEVDKVQQRMLMYSPDGTLGGIESKSELKALRKLADAARSEASAS